MFATRISFYIRKNVIFNLRNVSTNKKIGFPSSSIPICTLLTPWLTDFHNPDRTKPLCTEFDYPIIIRNWFCSKWIVEPIPFWFWNIMNRSKLDIWCWRTWSAKDNDDIFKQHHWLWPFQVFSLSLFTIAGRRIWVIIFTKSAKLSVLGVPWVRNNRLLLDFLWTFKNPIGHLKQ